MFQGLPSELDDGGHLCADLRSWQLKEQWSLRLTGTSDYWCTRQDLLFVLRDWERPTGPSGKSTRHILLRFELEQWYNWWCSAIDESRLSELDGSFWSCLWLFYSLKRSTKPKLASESQFWNQIPFCNWVINAGINWTTTYRCNSVRSWWGTDCLLINLFEYAHVAMGATLLLLRGNLDVHRYCWGGKPDVATGLTPYFSCIAENENKHKTSWD